MSDRKAMRAYFFSRNRDSERFVHTQKQLDRIMRMYFCIDRIRNDPDIVGVKKDFQHVTFFPFYFAGHSTFSLSSIVSEWVSSAISM